MRIDPITGLLLEAEFIASPNFDFRPHDQKIDLLVIHNISLPPGEFGTHKVQEFFNNELNPREHDYFKTIEHMKVSSHLFIERTGDIFQFVPFDKRAWHAGVSSFKGQINCNDNSIGIELEGTDEIPYTIEQYEQLSLVTACLFDAYPDMCLERVTGHSDIAPERKTDPGPAFSWEMYREMVNTILDNKPIDTLA